MLAELTAARDREREQTQAVNELRAEWQSAVSAQVSAEALQQAALGKASGKTTQWLKSNALDRRPRLGEQLRVERGWERAVETVLGSYLEAVCVDGLDRIAELLGSFEGGQLAIVADGEQSAGAATQSLQSKVQGASVLDSLLSAVYPAADLRDALRRRPSLRPGESVVTREGIWLGRDWLRISREQDSHAGVIEREESLRDLRSRVSRLAADLEQSELRLNGMRDRVRDMEDERERSQSEVNRLHREHLDRRAALETAQARTQDSARRKAQLDTELEDLQGELQRTELDVRAARGRLEQAIEALTALEPQRAHLEAQRDRLRTDLADARTGAQSAQQTARELALQVESRRSSHASLGTSLVRVEKQLESQIQRRDELAAQLGEGDAPLAMLQTDLERALVRRTAVEAEMHAAKLAADELEARLRECENDRLVVEQRLDAARHATEDARLAAEQVRVRRESLAEQLAATSFEFEALVAALAPDASVDAWEAALQETGGKIERLGQVNLAAIGEYKEQSERKEYLDKQHKDLTDALETLESAMRKIDRETRTRFQDTFDRVNAGLKDKFPRLFGGGHAYLELAGEDTSDAGVSVMARPPGKRNSTISQLSGGEKALTAVALVFAIFDLNPAPFCLLDEVDAPLDENNVDRFCDIVRDMSHNVQFIFITHNKSTMELASQLIGVTMSEPGVSRLVAVDVDEAVRMAAM